MPRGSALSHPLKLQLIMPEPCPFLRQGFPAVSIIRPTSIQQGGAVATIQGFTADGLFIGQSSEFFRVINELAEEADKAGQH